jgi:hypothetical protein
MTGVISGDESPEIQGRRISHGSAYGRGVVCDHRHALRHIHTTVARNSGSWSLCAPGSLYLHEIVNGSVTT